MRVVCVTREGREYSRAVSDYNESLRRRFGKMMETVMMDSAEGESLTRTLDITLAPTILAIDNLGRVKMSWRGLPLPQMDEVGYYLMMVEEKRGEEETEVEVEARGLEDETTRPVSREGIRLNPIKSEKEKL